ncbi:MAG TPA: ScyD/ScyE family protein [Phototrophicaceae bacterium]|nr:ScyD/ScyE family protein [Phototrophicaceae bacterium]
MRKYLVFLLALGLLTLFAAPTSAQQTNIIADGLNNPRGLYFDDNGVLWISEAGTAGDFSGQVEGLGAVQFGGTARVLTVQPGQAGAKFAVGGLPSAQGFDDMIGVNSIYANKDGLWLVTGLGPLAEPFDESVLNLDPKTFRVKQTIDLYSFEEANNPDQDVKMSDPVDIVQADDGTYYIADASGNDVLTWTAKDGLKLWHVWMDLPVPTSIDIGPDGNIYVGFLSPFPYDPGSARIEEWSPDGKLLKTFSNLTAVTDVLVDDSGKLYAVEMASGYGDTGWIPDSGSVVQVTDSGTTPVAENLAYPYRMAESSNGALVVTVDSAFEQPGDGKVILISGELPTLASTAEAPSGAETSNGTVEAPNSTPEASS